MAYTSVAPNNLAFTETHTNVPGALARRSLFARLGEALAVARTREADRAIAHYLADTGGKFTDDAEREIERRYLANARGW